MNTSSNRTGILRPASLLLGLLMANGGCAKLYHEFHYSPVGRQLAQHQATYYHSPHTGRIVPKDPCMQYGEPPCFGYESTCWQSWPSECVNCPPPPVTTAVSHVVQPVADSAPKSVVGEALPPSNASQPTPAGVKPPTAPPAMISADPIDDASTAPPATASPAATSTPQSTGTGPVAVPAVPTTPATPPTPATAPPVAPPADFIDEPPVTPPPAGAAPGSSGVDFPNPNQGAAAPSQPFLEAPPSVPEPVRIPQPTLIDPAPERSEAIQDAPVNVTDPPAEEPRPERSSRRPTEHRLAAPTHVELPQIEALTTPKTTPASPAAAAMTESGTTAPSSELQAAVEQRETESTDKATVEFPPALQESTASRLLKQAISQSGAIPVGPTARVTRVEPKPTEPAAAVEAVPVAEAVATAATPEAAVAEGAKSVSPAGKADIRFLGDASPAVIKPTSAGPRMRLGGIPRQATRPASLEVKFRN
ncbi:MAG: hypothetical protein U0795_16825 [Pirellulales bacterium]